jgi:hypothetical protein
VSKPTKGAVSDRALSYPLWLASVCAALCFVSAGYMGTTGGTWKEIYELMGVTLPWIQQFVLENPVALPLSLVAIGIASLSMTRVRVRSEAVNQSLSAVCTLAAIAAALSACMFVYANVLVFQSMQKALQQ